MKVKVFANLREICGGVMVEVFPEENRVLDVLNEMIERFPDLENEIFEENGSLKPFVHVYINGKNIIHDKYLQTEVNEQDQLAIFPPVAGG